MGAVIFHYKFNHAVAFVARHLKKVHGGKVHPKQLAHARRLVRIKPVVVRGHGVAEATCAHVEPVSMPVVVKVGVEAEEKRHPHHEHKVEIGEAAIAAVKPHDAVDDIVECGTVALLHARGVAYELCHEHGYRHLDRVEGD